MFMIGMGVYNMIWSLKAFFIIHSFKWNPEAQACINNVIIRSIRTIPSIASQLEEIHKHINGSSKTPSNITLV